MRRTLWNMRGLAALVVIVTMVVALACAAEEELEQPLPAMQAAPAAAAAAPAAAETVELPAQQAQQQPAPAAPARPAQLPAAAEGAAVGAVVRTASERQGEDVTDAMAEFEYMAPRLEPGAYPSHQWDGPIPTKFKESPQSAALVRSGDILPVEERLPVHEDIWVIAPYDEIGVYGGTMRITTHHVKTLDHLAVTSLVNGDPTGTSEPRLIKGWEVSDDGRKYTFTNRRGARWSDGYPMTIEDVRFAMEDLMYNEELNTTLPAELKSQITGNPARFAVVDDVTWTIEFDDPYFDLASSRHMWGSSKTRGCPRCYYAPSHIYKRYHVKYNPDEIEALMAQYEQESIRGLQNRIDNIRTGPGNDWRQSGPIPTEFDPNFIYRGDIYTPAMSELIQTRCCDGGRAAVRNHYFIGVDPEGNQMPYIDGQILILTEDRTASVFRAMNGENDYYGGSMILSELPLYMANMEKGDYSVYIFRSPAGNDSATAVQNEFVQDPEMGQLLRTKDFRKALSIAADRNEMNQVVASGIGTPQQWIPHPITPYYPGKEYADLDAGYDLDGAKAIMEKLGYSDANGDGYLDRKDGSGPLSLHYVVSSTYFPHIDVLQNHWGRLGIKVDIEEGNSSSVRKADPELPFEHHISLYSMNQWTVQWTRAFAGTSGSPLGAAMGDYWASFGEKGMAPTGGDSLYMDAYGNMAASGNYPADITGNIKRQQDIWRTGIQTGPVLHPERVEMGKEFWRISAEEKYNIGYLAFMGIVRGMTKKRNNLRNVPKNHVALEAKGILGAYYFEDGLDNINNPGNRSQKYKSVHFLDPDYWTQ
jgi:peptide/nickel transport system substrate-binding protein